MSRWLAYIWLGALVVFAVLGGGIANDRPLVRQSVAGLEFPAFSTRYSVTGPGGGARDAGPRGQGPDAAGTGWAVQTPVAYYGVRPDFGAPSYAPPLTKGARGRHLLGTDALGRDVAAALIRGSRTALITGVFGTLIAILIGVAIGGVAGFFGDRGLRIKLAWLIAGVASTIISPVYAFGSLWPFLRLTGFVAHLGALLLLWLVLLLFLSAALHVVPALRKRVAFPADAVSLQIVELFVNIPGAVLLLALVALAPKPSIWLVVLIFGLLSWPSVTRFVRAELLRVRALPYIEAARGSGVPAWRILWRHALPNALGPVVVLAGFLFCGAVLLEAFLSFLGIGIPADTMTWGTLLRQARVRPGAWWLAVFPGIFLSLTILAGQAVVRD